MPVNDVISLIRSLKWLTYSKQPSSYCQGDREPFKVGLPVNVYLDVDDLKQIIHTKGVNTTTSTVLPKDLILWKVWMLSAPP